MRTVSVGIRNVRFIAIKRRRTKRTKTAGHVPAAFRSAAFFAILPKGERRRRFFSLFRRRFEKRRSRVACRRTPSSFRGFAGTHGFLSVENGGIRRHLRIAKERNCKEKHSFSGLLKKRATIFAPRVGVSVRRYADGENRFFSRARDAVETCVEKINKNEEKQKNLGGKY